MLPGLKFVFAAIATTLVVAIFGLAVVVSLRTPTLFPANHPKANNLLADLVPPSEPAWQRNAERVPASAPLVVDIPRASPDVPVPATQAQSGAGTTTARAAGDETTGSIGGVAPGRDLAAGTTGASRTAKQTAAAKPDAPAPLEPSSDAPSAAVIIGDRPGRPPVLQQQSRPVRPEFIAQPSIPEPVEIAAVAEPRRTIVPVTMTAPLLDEARLAAVPIVAIPMASETPPLAPSPPVAQTSGARDVAKPVVLAAAKTAVTMQGGAVRDAGTAAPAATAAGSIAAPLKPAAAVTGTLVNTANETAALNIAAPPQRDATLMEIVADAPDAGSPASKTAEPDMAAQPDAPRQQQPMIALAPPAPAAPARNDAPAMPETAAPGVSEETSASTIATKPAQSAEPAEPAAEKEKTTVVAAAASAIAPSAAAPSAVTAATATAIAPAADNEPPLSAKPAAVAPAQATAKTTIANTTTAKAPTAMTATAMIAAKPASSVVPAEPAAETTTLAAAEPAAAVAAPSVTATIAIGDIPLPRPSPKRAALANAKPTSATNSTTAKPRVRRHRTIRRAQPRQQAPRDGLAEFFFGAGVSQPKQ